ncbi:hypothetical protein OAZ03_04305 [Gammaproteobacteria bacterium]|jgi:hypothetical protein|nr:hypothetical protein [Gammaproteobacteria bacterium]MDA9175284.1 hypothetical protein [Gammaproteobacteria bacterium]MDA9763020.1 hypothetical protein [Gammaproteobacteria bacterium]MDA9835229.1 hypothetical protein [Gammaproteobacteria bacterium]MDA9868727.1 hypothetical protein [Gammaproteobacteria bacterium]
MNIWRIVNPLVVLVARSPIHLLVSTQILVTQFNGRKSGNLYRVPVSFHKDKNTYTCVTLRSNLWWKNLIDLERTDVWLHGKLVNVQLKLEYEDDEVVKSNLRHLVSGNAIDAFFAKVTLNKDGSPDEKTLDDAAKIHTVLMFKA